MRASFLLVHNNVKPSNLLYVYLTAKMTIIAVLTRDD